MKILMKLWGGLFLAWHLSSCATSKQPEITPMDRPPSAKEVAAWHQKNGMTVANESEITKSNENEAKFVNGRAQAPNGKLRVIFRCGERVGSSYSNLSTTSVYVLEDSKGRELASGPGYLTKGEAAVQRAWFSPDGKQAVVFEYVHDCNGPPPLTIWFYEDSEAPGLWVTRFLVLPEFLNAPFQEGSHSECRGFLGDELLINTNTDGTISKKKIRDLKERYPFPFTIG